MAIQSSNDMLAVLIMGARVFYFGGGPFPFWLKPCRMDRLSHPSLIITS